MLILYSMAILFYGSLIFIASCWNNKAKKFISGRRKWSGRLKEDVGSYRGPLVWIHAASLGEFEQGRPVIEAIRRSKNKAKILLTFFSPSGYEIRKDYELADWVHYLPLDTPRNARQFIETVNPRLVIFIKYEFWYFYLKCLVDRKIRVIFISAIFRQKHFFIRLGRSFYRPVITGINHFFVQDEESKRSLAPLTANVTVTGDTRIDRVMAIAAQAKSFEIIDAFLGGEKCFIVGSSLPSDIKFLTPFIEQYQDKIRFIIVPHDIKEVEIARIQATFQAAFRYSDPKNMNFSRILIIDNVGMLSSLYRYAGYAFIGGGFRGSLHNILEAAVYGIPVFFGRHRNNEKFREVVELEQAGAAFPIMKVEELEAKFLSLEKDPWKYEEAAKASSGYLHSKKGATKQIIQEALAIL